MSYSDETGLESVEILSVAEPEGETPLVRMEMEIGVQAVGETREVSCQTERWVWLISPCKVKCRIETAQRLCVGVYAGINVLVCVCCRDYCVIVFVAECLSTKANNSVSDLADSLYVRMPLTHKYKFVLFMCCSVSDCSMYHKMDYLTHKPCNTMLCKLMHHNLPLCVWLYADECLAMQWCSTSLAL